MVTFTCGNCGSSFKKAKAETHFFQCRFSSLSCIDCQKDFTLETSKQHNKCFNEDEKYAAGGGSLLKPSVRKGEAKQSSWTDFIQDIFEKTRRTIDTASRNLIQTILKHDNIPRKKPKFINFVKSSHRNRFEPQTIENVWSILESEWKKTAVVVDDKGKPGEKAENQEEPCKEKEEQLSPSTTPAGNGDAVVEETEKSSSKKKKKHDKNKNESSTQLLVEDGDESTLIEENNDNNNINENVISKKKKKKKRYQDKSIDNIDEEIVASVEQPVVADNEKSNKKKKKRKHESNDYESINTAAEDNSANSNIEVGKIKKKKKHNKHNNEDKALNYEILA